MIISYDTEDFKGAEISNYNVFFQALMNKCFVLGKKIPTLTFSSMLKNIFFRAQIFAFNPTLDQTIHQGTKKAKKNGKPSSFHTSLIVLSLLLSLSCSKTVNSAEWKKLLEIFGQKVTRQVNNLLRFSR